MECNPAKLVFVTYEDSEQNGSIAMERGSNRFIDVLVRFLRDKSGATAIEYTLIVSIISLGILASFSLVSSEIGTIFTNMADTLSAAME